MCYWASVWVQTKRRYNSGTYLLDPARAVQVLVSTRFLGEGSQELVPSLGGHPTGRNAKQKKNTSHTIMVTTCGSPTSPILLVLLAGLGGQPPGMLWSSGWSAWSGWGNDRVRPPHFGTPSDTMGIRVSLFGNGKCYPPGPFQGVPPSCEDQRLALSPQFQPSPLSLGYDWEII